MRETDSLAFREFQTEAHTSFILLWALPIGLSLTIQEYDWSFLPYLDVFRIFNFCDLCTTVPP